MILRTLFSLIHPTRFHRLCPSCILHPSFIHPSLPLGPPPAQLPSLLLYSKLCTFPHHVFLVVPAAFQAGILSPVTGHMNGRPSLTMYLKQIPTAAVTGPFISFMATIDKFHLLILTSFLPDCATKMGLLRPGIKWSCSPVESQSLAEGRPSCIWYTNDWASVKFPVPLPCDRDCARHWWFNCKLNTPGSLNPGNFSIGA